MCIRDSLQAEATAKEMGAKSWRQVLALRFRISTSEAGRRLDEAAVLGPRRTLTGEPLDPVLPAASLAQARGLINGEHIKVVLDTMDRIPPAIDTRTRAQIEIDPRCRVGAQGTQGQGRTRAVPVGSGRSGTR